MAKKTKNQSISISNRKARFEYELLDTFTAGIQYKELKLNHFERVTLI